MLSVPGVASVRANGYDGSMPRYRDGNRLNAHEAIEILGITRWKFFDLVRKGIIVKHVDEPYVLGYYRRSEIEAYARVIREARMKSEENPDS